MTHADKFALCLSLAQAIVKAHREEAPEGCDPQNSWVAVGTAVVTTGVGLYQSNKASKDAKKAASAGGGKALPMPEFQPYDLQRTQDLAFEGDKLAYKRSDQDFNKRHSGVVAAEKLFESSVLRDQQGESELMPALQNEFMRAGLSKSLGAFGGNSSVLAPGSAGEANVARNLGVSIMGFQDRNRANRNNSLMMAEELFPRRTFGLSGSDVAGIDMSNTANQNNWNQANWQNAMGVQNAQQQQANELAQAQAAAKAQQTQALLSSATSIAQAGATAYGGRTSTTATGAKAPAYYNSTGPVYAGKVVA